MCYEDFRYDSPDGMLLMAFFEEIEGLVMYFPIPNTQKSRPCFIKIATEVQLVFSAVWTKHIFIISLLYVFAHNTFIENKNFINAI